MPKIFKRCPLHPSYKIKTAQIIQDVGLLEGRFGEMEMESNKGNEFRVYDSIEA